MNSRAPGLAQLMERLGCGTQKWAGYFVTLSKQQRQLELTVEIHFPFTDVFQLSLERRLVRNICSDHL